MTQKEIAENFLQMCAGGQARKAFEQYADAAFIHHNAFFPGDAASLASAMDEDFKSNPGKVFELIRSLEEGAYVATYAHVKQNTDDVGAVVVHWFRFEKGKIAELWDVGMPIPDHVINIHGVL